MSTPAGTLRRVSWSIVLEVGSRMSMSRLWVLISKCSRESLSMLRRPDDAEALDGGREWHGAGDARAGSLGGLDDLSGGLVKDPVVERLQDDSDLLSAVGYHFFPFEAGDCCTISDFTLTPALSLKGEGVCIRMSCPLSRERGYGWWPLPSGERGYGW